MGSASSLTFAVADEILLKSKMAIRFSASKASLLPARDWGTSGVDSEKIPLQFPVKSVLV